MNELRDINLLPDRLKRKNFHVSNLILLHGCFFLFILAISLYMRYSIDAAAASYNRENTILLRQISLLQSATGQSLDNLHTSSENELLSMPDLSRYSIIMDKIMQTLPSEAVIDEIYLEGKYNRISISGRCLKEENAVAYYAGLSRNEVLESAEKLEITQLDNMNVTVAAINYPVQYVFIGQAKEGLLSAE